MIIAPPLDPACETSEAIQVEARGLIKEVLDVGHKVHQMCFFEGQGFLLILEEVVKESLLDPRPLRLLKGGNVESVVDAEDMLQVLPPTTAVKFCCQPHGIVEGRPWSTSPSEAGFLQVLVVVEYWASTRRADCPPDTAAAHLPSPACLWSD